VLCGLCVDRRVLAVLIGTATIAAQDVPTTREITLTLTEGTSMAAAVSPDRRSIAIDLLGALWVLPIRGGTAKRITPELLEARLPPGRPTASRSRSRATGTGRGTSTSSTATAATPGR